MPDLLVYSIAITALVISDALLIVLGWRLLGGRSTPAAATNHAAFEQDLKALALSVSMLGERLTRIENRLSGIQEREEQRPTPKEAGHKAYEVAAKMATQGAKVDEIIALCGLTRGEAELIHMLHAAKLN